jgi:hypothetical protein
VSSLLEPEARSGWYLDWADGCLPKTILTPMIELWKYT